MGCNDNLQGVSVTEKRVCDLEQALVVNAGFTCRSVFAAEAPRKVPSSALHP